MSYWATILKPFASHEKSASGTLGAVGPGSQIHATLVHLRLNPVPALFVIALLLELIYFGYFVRTFPLLTYYRVDIDMGGITGHSVWGFWSFVAAFAVLFALMAAAWWLVQGCTRRTCLWLVLGLGAIFGITMTFVYPITAIDLFTYVDQSRIMLHYHQNPVFVPPAAFPTDTWMQLADGWRTVGAPYGPIGIVLDALPMSVAGGNLLLDLVLLKLLFSGTTVLNGYLAYRITLKIKPEAALGSAVLVAWNPVILFEISANGHNDGMMMLLALGGLLLLQEGGLVSGTVVLLASALVKYATAILIPLVLVYALSRCENWRARIVYLTSSVAIAFIVVAVTYLPFWRGFDTFSRSLLENQLRVESFSSVVLDQLGASVSPNTATLIGRVLFIPIYAYALWLARLSFADLLRGCFFALFAFLGLAVTNFKIWYATWPTFLAAASGRVQERTASILFGFGTTVSAAFYGYLWVWKGVSRPDSFPFVNNLAYVVAFLPATLILVAWRSVDWSGSGRSGTANGSDIGVPVTASRQS